MQGTLSSLSIHTHATAMSFMQECVRALLDLIISNFIENKPMMTIDINMGKEKGVQKILLYENDDPKDVH